MGSKQGLINIEPYCIIDVVPWLCVKNYFINQKQKNTTTEWQNQPGDFTTNQKVYINLCLLEFSSTKILIWEFHVDDLTKSRCDIILGRDITMDLVLDLKYSKHIIAESYGKYKGCTSHMVDLINCSFIPSNLENEVTPKRFLWMFTHRRFKILSKDIYQGIWFDWRQYLYLIFILQNILALKLLYWWDLRSWYYPYDLQV